MKKVLVLGAYDTEIDIIVTIQQLGFYAICTDNHIDWNLSPAKYVSNEAWDVSWTDFNTLKKKCIDNHVDGIVAGFSEPRVKAANELSIILGKPFYSIDSNLSIIQDKHLFKIACSNSGIKVAKTFDKVDAVAFPVIVKPVDNGGSKGISICNSTIELIEAIKKAEDSSFEKKIIIEEYLSGPEVMIYFNVYDGIPVFSCMCDRLMEKYDSDTTQIPIGYIFTSNYYDVFVNYNLDKYISLIKNLNIKNGLIAFQAFVIGDDVIPFDPTYRLDGTTAYKITEHSNGVSSLKNIIFHCLGDNRYNDYKMLENPRLDGLYFELPILLTSGTITEIRGTKEVELLDEIIYIRYIKKVGDTLIHHSHFSQMLCRIQIKTNSVMEMKKCIASIFRFIRVLDENGQDMILNRDSVVKYIDNYE